MTSYDYAKFLWPRRMKRVAICSTILLANLTTALADPSPEVRRLMNEPVSMLDWGLDRLAQQASRQVGEKLRNGGEVPDIDAGYDWKLNQLELYVNYYEPQKAPKALCRTTINLIRRTLSPTVGKSKRLNLWVSAFQHNGYALRGTPEEALLTRSLPGLLVIKTSVAAAEGDQPFVNCSGPLLGDGISFEE